MDTDLTDLTDIEFMDPYTQFSTMTFTQLYYKFFCEFISLIFCRKTKV